MTNDEFGLRPSLSESGRCPRSATFSPQQLASAGVGVNKGWRAFGSGCGLKSALRHLDDTEARIRASSFFRHSSFVIRHCIRAFSLLEVMIALGIFFMAVFAILGLVSNTLRNARSLERPQVDAGLAAAIFTNTNRFYEGTTEGDFGDDLPGYSWYAETYEFASNGLVQADIVLEKRGSSQPAEALSILMFDPNFKSSSLPRGH